MTNMDNSLLLYEELKLIEKSERDINPIWKGTHLLLFFLAFVFGSFCTFCFHVLMYLFDEKCVLFPKLLLLTSLRQNIIYEFIPEEKENANSLPVDFLNTQWVEKSVCYLPTFVPLVSAIFGLVWTTMFLMYSTGQRVLTGLQRPWRVLPPVFIFSLAMGILCLYTSVITHFGLKELCLKLSEITGSTTCSFTVNVATLAYERRIRGVYQAIVLTIISAWMHTLCWLLSAIVTLVRVVMVVDFQLIKISARLHGTMDSILERNEKQMLTISPTSQSHDAYLHSSYKVHFKKGQLNRDSGEILYFSNMVPHVSNLSLVPSEQMKREKKAAYNAIPKNRRFILRMLHDILETIPTKDFKRYKTSSTSAQSLIGLKRQLGQQRIISHSKKANENVITSEEAEKIAREVKNKFQLQATERKENTISPTYVDPPKDQVERKDVSISDGIKIKSKESLQNSGDDEMTSDNKPSDQKRSNLKHVGVQTKLKGKVHIDSQPDSRPDSQPDSRDLSDNNITKDNKNTQTKKEKTD